MKNLQKLAAASTLALSTAFSVALTPAAHAQSNMDHGKMDAMKPAQSTAAPEMTDGEVRKIDMEAGKLTLKHGDIKNLDMPGMTMVFVVKDKAMLDKLKTGDKVKFKAINDAGKFTVTEIQPAP